MTTKLWIAAVAGATVLFAQPGNHLTQLRQLTNGGQNAEAYWSPDGRQLIFQSTREGHECDQIYVMNADGSGQRMVSTGKGRTTCAYFLKDGKRFVYASTHEAGEKCPPPPDRSRGYVWGVFPGYDIFVAALDGTILKKLTTEKVYDAEATVNWRRDRIVYTSLATGDLELWTMKADGTNKTQITRKEGYDGGAVFSRDGRKLAWRANHPKTPEAMERYRSLLRDHLTAPMKMEIVIADADGSHQRQITDFGCASFAPTFSPDGKTILFASNKHNCDGRKFELFRVRTDGSGLEQITDFGGFTSFPEFSPDGTRLVFASDKGAKSRYEFNIFVADWRE